jgi:hypothetical protein
MKTLLFTLFAFTAAFGASASAFTLPKADCQLRFTEKYSVEIDFSQAKFVNDHEFIAPYAEDSALLGGNICSNFNFETQSASCTQEEAELTPTLFRINTNGVIHVMKNIIEGLTVFKLESDGPHASHFFKSRKMDCEIR